jgi:transcriptional regulator, lysR family
MTSIAIYYGTMELRYLQSFEAVVRCGGFTKAAADLHLAQPAISAHIKRLEQDLGVKLLHRSRTVTLSAAGERFLPYARVALANLEEGKRLMQSFRTVTAGHVRVAVTPLTGNVNVVDLLANFRNRYPGVTVSLQTGLIAELLSALEQGRVDVVIGPANASVESKEIRRKEITSERLTLITPLAGLRQVTSLSDVKDEPFVCLQADSGLRRLLEKAFTAINAKPRVEFETHSPSSIRELVAANLGCALIAQSVAEGPGPAVQIHDIRNLPKHPPISAIWKAGIAPPIVRFIEELTAFISIT